MASPIFIANLHHKVDVTELCKMFGKYGRILSADVEYDKYLDSMGSGHIVYDNSTDADLAAKEMNGEKVREKPIFVTVEKNVNGQIDISKNEYFKKVYVKNIDLGWDDYDLIGQFERFGEIDDAKISETDGISKGCGFVKFRNHSSAKAAVEVMHNRIINGKNITVQPFIFKDVKDNARSSVHFGGRFSENTVQLNNLYIKNLPKDVDDYELKKMFQSFGPIQSVKVATDKNQISKGYGFVCFFDEKVAAKALDQMHHLSYKSKILEIDFYQKKSNHNSLQSKFKEGKFSQPEMAKTSENRIFPADKNTVFSFSAKRY